METKTLNIMQGIELVDWEYDDCPVVYKNKVYQMCFIYDGGIVLKDDINGCYAFPGNEKYEKQMKDIKHLSYRGHIQFGDTQSLQKMLTTTKEGEQYETNKPNY